MLCKFYLVTNFTRIRIKDLMTGPVTQVILDPTGSESTTQLERQEGRMWCFMAKKNISVRKGRDVLHRIPCGVKKNMPR